VARTAAKDEEKLGPAGLKCQVPPPMVNPNSARIAPDSLSWRLTRFFALPMRTSSSVLGAGTCGTSRKVRKARLVKPYSARNCGGRHSTGCADAQRSCCSGKFRKPKTAPQVRFCLQSVHGKKWPGEALKTRRSHHAATGGRMLFADPAVVALATRQPHCDLPVAQSVNPMSVTFSALMLAMASRSAMSAPWFMRAGLPAS